MRYNILFLSLVAATIIIYPSCDMFDISKDFSLKDIQDDDLKTKTETDKACFVLVYPISYTMPNGDIVSGENEMEVNDAIKAWYLDHPDFAGKPQLVYPVEVVIGDDVKLIENKDQMILLKKSCNDHPDSNNGLTVCDWNIDMLSNTDVWTTYVVEPLVVNDSCGCVTEGVVKYVKNGSDFALVLHYGNRDCDNWAVLVKYPGGDSKKVTKCKIELDCDPN